MRLLLLRFLYRKMWNTRWLTISTLVGLIVAVAFTTSIPMYSDGALKRVVSSSLKENNDGFPAGSLLMRYQALGSDRADLEAFADVKQFIEEDVPARVGFEYATYVQALSLRGAQLSVVDSKTVDPSKRRQMTLASMSKFTDHADLTNGAWPSQTVQNGVIEAVVLEEGAFRNFFRVGDAFFYPAYGSNVPLRVKVVGTYRPLNDTSPYWYQGLEGLVNTLIVDESLMMNELLKKRNLPLNLATWYYAFDLRNIQTSDLAPLTSTLDRLDIELYQHLKETKVDLSFQKMLKDFRAQSLQLQLLLFTLAAPMLAMVFYYIAMNAKQSLDRQKSDIAVLQSRGAGTKQIIWMYVLEGLILGGIALVAGPLLGWLMAKSIGSASGFLTFVDRQSIPVGFGVDAMLYGLAAVFIAIMATVIPAIQFARSSIVGLKQQMARVNKAPVWQRFFLDFALFGVACYGWYLFQERQMISMQTGLSSDQLQVQPTLFFVPALAIFSIGLIALRLFPLILRFFNWLGRAYLPVPLFLTLTQLSRSSKSYYPLMLLLILTLGLGVYNASAARTIDQNSTERTLYQFGSDVIIQSVWEGFAEPTGAPQQPANPGGGVDGDRGDGGGGNGGGQPGGGGGTPPPPQQVFYIEPPFRVFEELPGVEHASRVLQTRGNVVISGKSIGQGTIMGIENDGFANVAWWRNDLYPAHPFLYLDVMGDYEQALIIPEKIADKYQLVPGDLASISIQGTMVEFVIVGVLPYWPSQYPDVTPFFIANIDYIYDQVPIIPYEVWLKMEDGAKVTPIVEELQAKGIGIASVKDVRNELIVQQKHPARGGVFGILSLGFLVSVVISLIGYVLYWFFNLSSRVVQFGVLRAMGLSRRGLTGMLFLEQAFTAGLSIAFGLGIGRLASVLFLPFLQTTESAASQVPPFRVVFEASDMLQLYGVVIVMIVLGAGLLLTHIRRLRVHQAVKLGEER
jgi:putative ABC transport system permease protein